MLADFVAERRGSGQIPAQKDGKEEKHILAFLGDDYVRTWWLFLVVVFHCIFGNNVTMSGFLGVVGDHSPHPKI